MKLTVKRIKSDAQATLSLVELDGKFLCFGLEDTHRETKIAGKTRIPAGTYDIAVRETGGFYSRYIKRFRRFHKGMLHVQNVPNFEYILIHIGNRAKDTAGCLLVGAGASTDGPLTITQSTSAYEQLYKKVIKAAHTGELTIEYLDLDRV